MFKHIFILLLVVLLSATCGRPPQTRYYDLELSLKPQPLISAMPLFIHPFEAAAPLDQEHFIYKTSPYEVQRDPYRRWVQPPHLLLTDQARAFFRRNGLMNVVNRLPVSREVCELTGRVEHFEELAGGPQRFVRIAVWFEAGHGRSGRIFFSRLIEKRAPIEGNGPEDIVAAMSRAVEAVFSELAEALQTSLPKE